MDKIKNLNLEPIHWVVVIILVIAILVMMVFASYLGAKLDKYEQRKWQQVLREKELKDQESENQ